MERSMRDSLVTTAWGRVAVHVTKAMAQFGMSPGKRVADVEDFTQATIERFIRACDTGAYKPELMAYEGFLKVCARNAVKDWLKLARNTKGLSLNAQGALVTVDEDGEDSGEGMALQTWTPDPETALLRKEQAERINAALETLPEMDRSIVAGMAEHGEAGEVGADLGLSANAVRIRKCRAMKALRSELEDAEAPTTERD